MNVSGVALSRLRLDASLFLSRLLHCNVLAGPPCTPFSPMGLITGELHPAHECHEVYYKNMKRSQPDVLIIENVVEYKLETAQSRLGRRYSCFDVCIDPRLFGFPTARARRYIVALKKCTVAWNPNISLHDVILCLRRQPIMSPMDYFFMPVPPTLLTTLTTASGSLFSRAPWQRCSN